MKTITKNNLHLIIATLIFLLLQMIVSPLLAINNISPDFILILVITYALLTTPIKATIYSFFVGFFIDLYFSYNFGTITLQYLIAGFVASYFHFNNVYLIKQYVYKYLFIVLFCTIVSSLSLLFLTQTIFSYLFFYNFLSNVILTNLYNVIIAFIIITILPGKMFYEHQ